MPPPTDPQRRTLPVLQALPVRRNEPRLARVNALAAFTLLILGTIDVLIEGVTVPSLLRAFPLLLGGLLLLIVGTSRMLVAGFTRRSIAGPALLAFVPTVLVLGAATGTYFHDALDPTAALMATSLWLPAIAGHAVVLAATVRGLPPQDRPGPRLPHPYGPLTVPLHIALVLYGVAGSLAYPIAVAGKLSAATAVHLLLPGFVLLTILTAASRILPRFTDVAYPGGLLRAAAVLASVGPAFLAWGVGGPGAALRVGALIEATGLGLFATATLTLLLRSPRFRPSHLAYGAAALCLLAGLALGLGFAVDPALRRWVPLHGFLNLFGFVGLVVVGAAIDLYGPSLLASVPAYRAQTRATIALAWLGVVLFPALYLLGASRAAWGLLPHLVAFALLWVGLAADVLRPAGTHRRQAASSR